MRTVAIEMPFPEMLDHDYLGFDTRPFDPSVEIPSHSFEVSVNLEAAEATWELNLTTWSQISDNARSGQNDQLNGSFGVFNGEPASLDDGAEVYDFSQDQPFSDFVGAEIDKETEAVQAKVDKIESQIETSGKQKRRAVRFAAICGVLTVTFGLNVETLDNGKESWHSIPMTIFAAATLFGAFKAVGDHFGRKGESRQRDNSIATRERLKAIRAELDENGIILEPQEQGETQNNLDS